MNATMEVAINIVKGTVINERNSEVTAVGSVDSGDMVCLTGFSAQVPGIELD